MGRAVAATLLVASAAALSPVAAGAATVAIAPATIPADCSRDVTADLQAFIDATPDGATLEFTAGACYRVDGTLAVQKRSDLVIHGNGATFRQVTDGTELVNPKKIRTRNIFTVGSSTGVTVTDVVIRGANPYAGVDERAYRPVFEAQHGVIVIGSSQVLFDRVEVTDVYGDFVWLGPGNRGVTVQNSTFARNGRQGWTINGTDILFQGNSITDTRRATIDMEPSLPTWGSHNVTIRDNDIGRGRLLFFASVGAGNAAIDGVNILDNRLHRTLQIYICSWGQRRTNYRIVGNVTDKITSGSGSTIGLRNVGNVEIAGNYVRLQPSHKLFGVGARNVSGLTVHDNTFPGADGVWIDRGENAAVRQWGNQLGPVAALFPATASYTFGPTPIPVRG